MANPGYVRSTDGSDADDGSTWTLANATLAGAITDAAAGDRLWISDNHAESTAATIALTFPGTIGSPNQILCGDDSAEPPTALATTATVTTTGNSDIRINGFLYAYGISFSCGTGAVSPIIYIGYTASCVQRYEACNFAIAATGSSASIQCGGNNINAPVQIDLINCTFKLAASGQLIRVSSKTQIIGGSWASGGTSPTNVIGITGGSQGEGCDLLVDGFDFSNLSSSVNLLVGGATQQPGRAVFRNCKLPASWSGGLFSAAVTSGGFRAEMWNCSATDTNYGLWVEDCAGSIKHETTIVHTGGASDGTTPISWKMASTANAEYPVIVLRSPEIYVNNTTTGSSKTLTVEIAQDGTTTALNDDEIWLEVEYLGTSGVPLALFANDAKADVLASAAAQDTSSVTWSGLSGTNKKQYLQKAVTPQEAGVFIVRVCLAKASTTVYVDPLVTVS